MRDHESQAASEPTKRRGFWVGALGILFVVLSLAIVVLAPAFPTSSASATEVAAYYTRYGTRFLIGNYLAVFALLFSFPLLAYLAYRIKQRDQNPSWLWLMMFGSSILAHAVGAVDLTFYQLLPVVVGQGVPAL